MVKVIAFCSTKNQTVNSPIARHFAEHLQWYFGPTKLVYSSLKTQFEGSISLKSSAHTCVAEKPMPRSDCKNYLNDFVYSQDVFCGNLQRSELRINHHPQFTRTVCKADTFASNIDYNDSDFIVLDGDFGPLGLKAVNKTKIDELVIVLEDTVSRYSEAYQFIKDAVHQSGIRRFNILVNCGICRNRAEDIYDRLDGLLGGINGLEYRFIGFVPSFNNDPKFKTLETLTLQNIAHELLDLKYGDKIHKIPKAMFEGALH